jgi:hypothetical protein
MQVGLLWFDNDPQRAVASKIEDAAQRYREKFGRSPDTCYVNQKLFDKGPAAVAAPCVASHDVRVVPAANVLPHHFWIGEDVEREA